MDFLTPIIYDGSRSWGTALCVFADETFSWSDHCGIVISGKEDEVVVFEREESFYRVAMKIAIFSPLLLFAIPIPVIIPFTASTLPASLLMIKIVFRNAHDFTLSEETKKEETKEVDAPHGLPNIGATCYFNSALQLFLTIPGLADKIPAKSNPILSSLKRFMLAYQNKPSASKLRTLIRNFHDSIFRSKYKKSVFVDNDHFGDSMQVMELIFSFLELQYEVEHKKIPRLDGKLQEKFAKKEKLPQSMFWLKSEGKTIQQKVKNQSKPTRNEAPWNHDNGTQYQEFDEEEKILSSPPETFVVNIMNAEGKGHPIDPKKDLKVDFGPLFKHGTKKGKYELIGFGVNYRNYHWISVVKKNGKWYKCDDSSVKKIDLKKNEFSASCLIYARVGA